MEPTFASLAALVRETFSDPRAGMRRVLDLDLPDAARWQALALVAVLSAILSQLSLLLVPAGGGMMMGVSGSPIRVMLLQVVILGLIVAGVYRIGRGMGGHGDLAGSVMVVVWLQVVMIALQVAQLLAVLLVPPLAGLIGIASIAVFFWLLTSFVSELHGFEGRGKVFGVILLSFFGFAFVLAFAMSILGLAPPMEP